MSVELLLVEDDRSQIRQYRLAVDRWNEGPNAPINLTEATDRDSAEEALRAGNYDAAILDLRFPGDPPEQASGNEVLKLIKDQLRYPIYVVSGNPGDLDGQFDDHPFIEAITRGDMTNDDLLRRIFERYSTGITKILGGRGRFEAALNRVFWDHLPHAIDHWEKDELDSDVKERQLLRYTLSHLQEILSVDDVGEDELHNTAETYIKPAIKCSVSAGLILQQASMYFMVITPACDISQGKAEYYQLIKLIRLSDHKKVQSKPRSNSRKSKLESLIKNSEDRYHYLPKFDDLDDMLVDFQHVITVPVEMLDESYNRVCSVASTFYKDIVSRFSSYYARQGSPDFDSGHISQQLNDELPAEPAA